MNVEDLNTFIDGATNYFSQMSNRAAVVETPYLENTQRAITHEFTGIISISGKKKGCVYFSAPRNLLKHLLLTIGELDTSNNALSDLVGEVANTIAGNARQYFGSEFMISVPVVVTSKMNIKNMPPNPRSYVIPVTWRKHEAAVVICLE